MIWIEDFMTNIDFLVAETKFQSRKVDSNEIKSHSYWGNRGLAGMDVWWNNSNVLEKWSVIMSYNW